MTSQALPTEKGQPSVSTAGPSAKPTVQCSEPFYLPRNNGVSFNDADNVSVQTYIDAFTAHIPPPKISDFGLPNIYLPKPKRGSHRRCLTRLRIR